MGVYSYSVRVTFPEELTDAEEEREETELASEGFDVFGMHYSYRGDGYGSYTPPHTEEEAKKLAQTKAKELKILHPELRIQVVKERSCLCCPTDVYEGEEI